MGYWNSRGLRGSNLEEIINLTNDKYREKGIALVQKIPTPIKPIEIDKASRHITLAYFEQKSTVDFIGVAQKIPLCFDAKETVQDAIPLKNIHKHQIEFMEDFEKQGGISFFIVYFTTYNEYYYLTLATTKQYIDAGKTRIKREDIGTKYKINSNGLYINYLDMINVDLNDR
ncbi:MAG: Penicillin-binding protein-related factor putative recombinase [Clostridiales bacterium]|jgi:recombination protein U|nr:Penicillin-binding protein-related factor putative recombinase [Clostridiales bacterium]